METYLRASTLASLLAEQAENLKRTTGGRLFRSVRKPYCDAPVSVALGARAPKRGDVIRESGNPVFLDLWVPCRKCGKCGIVRQIQWRKRVKHEIITATRSWFVTLTFRPEAREKLFYETITDNDGEYSRMLTLKSRSAVAMRELASYLKRLRNGAAQSGLVLRFVAVTEPHKDDFPHIHLILHSTGLLTASMIRAGKWPHGFIDMKLCDADAANYLVKYISKEAIQVRASVRYGANSIKEKTSNHVTKTAKAKSEGEGHDLPTPGGMVRIKMLNKQVPLVDGVALLSTILELSSLETETPNGPPTSQTDYQTVPATAVVKPTAAVAPPLPDDPLTGADTKDVAAAAARRTARKAQVAGRAKRAAKKT